MKLLFTLILCFGCFICLENGLLLRPPYNFNGAIKERRFGKSNWVKKDIPNAIVGDGIAVEEGMSQGNLQVQQRQYKETSELIKKYVNIILKQKNHQQW